MTDPKLPIGGRTELEPKSPCPCSLDADPAGRDPVLWLQYTNTHGLQKSCGGKGTVGPFSQEESALTTALTDFYCFSRLLTSKMVLIYYA